MTARAKSKRSTSASSRSSRASSRRKNLSSRASSRRKRNPPAAVQVHQFGGKRGHLVGVDVFAIEYKNTGSAQRSAYRHDFDSRGIELWALVDGSLLIRHKSHRLWDDFTVSDSE